MCSDYELNIPLDEFLKQVRELDNFPPVVWGSGSADRVGLKPHIRIADNGVVARLQNDRVQIELMSWSWEERGRAVFNVGLAPRFFANSSRCLILASGFYECSSPSEPRGRWPDQHLFRLREYKWFWIPGIVKRSAFAMLKKPRDGTVNSDRKRICVLPPSQGIDWLQLTGSVSNILTSLPEAAFETSVLCRNRFLRTALGYSRDVSRSRVAS